MKTTACTLGYVIRGVRYGKSDREALSTELLETVEAVTAVTALPVVDGIALELEVADIAPFSEASYEPYVCEHILGPAVAARCDATGDAVEFRLINKRFQ